MITDPFLGWLNISTKKNFENNLIMLQGEVYNREAPSQKLSAEMILQIYLSEGHQCVSQFTGHFAFAIFLIKKQEVFFIRDKIGVYNLFYTLQDNGILISNHCHFLKSHISKNISYSAQSIYHYFYFHYIPSPYSIYENIYTLEPGHYGLFKKGKLKITPYWTAQFSHIDSRSIKEKKSNLQSILNQTINKNTLTSETGCFLSGGIDSSTILGYLSHQGKKKIKAFSIGFDDKKFNEMEYAEIAAKHFKADHIKYFVTPNDIIESLHFLTKNLDQPFGNASLLPTYFCAKLAKEHGINCLLAGDGGDELFGGNTRYATQALFSRYYLLPKFLRKKYLEPYAKRQPLSYLKIINKISRYIIQAQIPMPDRQEQYNLLNHIGPKNIFTPYFLQQINQQAPLDLLRNYYAESEADSLLSRMLSLDLKFTLADNDLPKVLSACQFNNISVQFPFLDDQLIHFALRLPDHDKVNGTQLRYFYKKAMSDFLPSQIINKKKHGFGLPFGIWLLQNTHLQDFVYDTLHSLKQREIVQPRFIDELTNTLLSQHPSYYGALIWTLIIFELWIQIKN